MIGETIGKYRIVARLGRGGMGTVYRAVDETLDRDVAIKVLNPGLTESDLLKRFRAEAITLARLNHPNIATIYELGQHGDELLMVMEFVRGETFDKLSERTGPMPFERAAYLCAQVLDALGHAHRSGVVHRDMKPANLMLAESGVVKVMDFGIARIMGTEHLTNDGYMMGTPAYMAPEQVMGEEVDGRADIYGVGVILFRLLTSHLPFKADTAMAMVQKQIKDPPTPLRQLRAELPEWCERIIDRALEKSPAARYQTAEEFRAALLQTTNIAPSGEVRSVLTPASLAADLEMTVAPDSMPTPLAPASRPSPSTDAPAADPTLSATRTMVAAVVPTARLEVPKTTPEAVAMEPEAAAAVTTPAAPGATGAVTPAARVPAPAAASNTSKKPYAAIGLAAAVVLIAGGVMIALRQGSATPVADSPQAVSPAVAESPQSAAPPPPTASVEPPAPAADTTAAQKATVPPVAAPAPRRARTDPPSNAAGAATPASTAAVPAARALPPLSFPPAHLLVVKGDRGSEQQVALSMADGAIALTEPRRGNAQKAGAGAAQSDAKIVKSIPYSDVIAVYYSRSREPEWQSPAGAVVKIAKVDGGAFGFIRGDRDWVSVRTKSSFVTLRPDGSSVARLLAALEERTGVKVVRVGKGGAAKD